jgi:hypothetical protein
MTQTTTIMFDDKEPKNHSIRWNSTDKDAAVSSIYIRKPLFGTAKKIRVTIEEVS